MKTFRQFCVEQYLDLYTRGNSYTGNRDGCEIFKNPSRKEMIAAASRTERARRTSVLNLHAFIFRNDVFVWEGAVHGDVWNFLVRNDYVDGSSNEIGFYIGLDVQSNTVSVSPGFEYQGMEDELLRKVESHPVFSSFQIDKG